MFTGSNPTAAVVDFEVKISKSDHQPCTVTVFVEGSHSVQIRKQPLTAATEKKWNPQNAITSKNALESMTVPHSNSTKDLYNAIKDSIVEAAKEANMIQVCKPTSNYCHNHPWFDRECRLSSAKVNKAFRICKKHRFTEKNTKVYIQHKNDGRILLKNKRKQHFRKLQEKISVVKNPTDFWNAIKSVN